jgi:hypothetical protein
MIQDDLRIAERVKNEGQPGTMIVGQSQGNGMYMIFAQTMFGVHLLGYMHWNYILDLQPSWKVLGDITPTMFSTVAGFEDIWAYFEVLDEDIDKAVVMIRELNQKSMDAEGVR